jgi:hypothetical protein
MLFAILRGKLIKGGSRKKKAMRSLGFSEITDHGFAKTQCLAKDLLNGEDSLL